MGGLEHRDLTRAAPGELQCAGQADRACADHAHAWLRAHAVTRAQRVLDLGQRLASSIRRG